MRYFSFIYLFLNLEHLKFFLRLLLSYIITQINIWYLFILKLNIIIQIVNFI